MKKILVIILSIVFMMSMTVTSFGFVSPYSDPEVSLSSCTAAGVANGGMGMVVTLNAMSNSEYDALLISEPNHAFCRLAAEDQSPCVVYDMVNEIGGNDEYTKVMGMYNIDCSTGALDELKFYPSISGIVPSTKAIVYVYDGCMWNRYNTEANFGTLGITNVTITPGGDNYVALVVDASTLIPGMSIIQLTAKDANGVPLIGSAAVFPINYGFPNAPQEIRDFYTLNTHRSAIQAIYPEAENLEVISFMDIHFEEVGEGSFPLTITFNVEGVTSKSNVVIRHLNEHDVVETIPTVCGDGTVTAEFSSLSPIIMYSYGHEAGDAPIMGDGPIALIMLLGIFSLIGLGYTFKKNY